MNSKNDQFPKPLRTHRAGKRPYFSYARETAQDNTLSWEARGVLAYLLSKPDDWIIQPQDLEQGCGRDRVYTMLKELMNAGYIVRRTERKSGMFDKYVYDLYEIPEPPYTPLPYTAEPLTANPHITDKRVLQNRENTEDSPALVSDETQPEVFSEPSQPSGLNGQPETENLPHSKKNESYTETQPEPESANTSKDPLKSSAKSSPEKKTPKKGVEKVEGSVTPGQMFQAFLDAAMCHKTDKQNADKLDEPETFGSYLGLTKKLIKGGVTIEQMTAMGKMYQTYLKALPQGTATFIRWDVGYITSCLREARGLLGKVTPVQVTEYVRLMCREEFNKTRVFPFTSLNGIQSWLTTSGGKRTVASEQPAAKPEAKTHDPSCPLCKGSGSYRVLAGDMVEVNGMPINRLLRLGHPSWVSGIDRECNCGELSDRLKLWIKICEEQQNG